MSQSLFSDQLFNPSGFRSRPKQRGVLTIGVGNSIDVPYDLRIAGFGDLLRARDRIQDSWSIELVGDLGRVPLVDAIYSLGTPESYAIDVSHPDGWSSEVVREAASVAQRREALLRSGLSFSGGDMRVSVLCCSNRPGQVLHIFQEMHKQRGVELELILGLHGDAWEGVEVDASVCGIDFPVSVLRLPRELTLGSCLNVLAGQAQGALLARIDDDDHYGIDHLQDLLIAKTYSRAGMVGAVAEYVWFEEDNVSIRRWIGDSEVPAIAYPTGRVTGGALLIDRDVFEHVGGFPDLAVFEDGGLADRIHDAGSFVYRTHSLGYLMRRGLGHTFVVSNDHFARSACERVEGKKAPLVGSL